jgi:hypothetical protein
VPSARSPLKPAAPLENLRLVAQSTNAVHEVVDDLARGVVAPATEGAETEGRQKTLAALAGPSRGPVVCHRPFDVHATLEGAIERRGFIGGHDDHWSVISDFVREPLRDQIMAERGPDVVHKTGDKGAQRDAFEYSSWAPHDAHAHLRQYAKSGQFRIAEPLRATRGAVVLQSFRLWSQDRLVRTQSRTK